MNAEMRAWRRAETTPVRVVNGKVIAPSPYVANTVTVAGVTYVTTTDGDTFEMKESK
jgi:hypothetical protein